MRKREKTNVHKNQIYQLNLKIYLSLIVMQMLLLILEYWYLSEISKYHQVTSGHPTMCQCRRLLLVTLQYVCSMSIPPITCESTITKGKRAVEWKRSTICHILFSDLMSKSLVLLSYTMKYVHQRRIQRRRTWPAPPFEKF